MNPERRRLTLAAGALWLLPTAPRAQAQPDALAALDAAQRRAVQHFLKRSSSSQEGAAQADQVALADIDGDKKDDLVLLWIFMGPTYAWSRVTLFKQQGTQWRDVASTEVWGQTEGLSIQGGEIRVRTLMPAKNDPRCCPTLKKVQRIRWAGGKLQSSQS